MRIRQLRFGLVTALVVLLTSCASLPPSRHLTEEEQSLYRVYRHLMTLSQLRTYLARPTPAARAAFARQVGAAQALEALPENERTAVLNGHPFEGMSRQALYLLWGEPYWREGRPPAHERWWYLGDYVSLPEYGNRYGDLSTIMEVQLVNDRVEWWQERVPSDKDHFLFRRPGLRRHR